MVCDDGPFHCARSAKCFESGGDSWLWHLAGEEKEERKETHSEMKFDISSRLARCGGRSNRESQVTFAVALDVEGDVRCGGRGPMEGCGY